MRALPGPVRARKENRATKHETADPVEFLLDCREPRHVEQLDTDSRDTCPPKLIEPGHRADFASLELAAGEDVGTGTTDCLAAFWTEKLAVASSDAGPMVYLDVA